MKHIHPHIYAAIRNTCAKKKPGWQAGLADKRSVRYGNSSGQCVLENNYRHTNYGEKSHQE